MGDSPRTEGRRRLRARRRLVVRYFRGQGPDCGSPWWNRGNLLVSGPRTLGAKAPNPSVGRGFSLTTRVGDKVGGEGRDLRLAPIPVASASGARAPLLPLPSLRPNKRLDLTKPNRYAAFGRFAIERLRSSAADRSRAPKGGCSAGGAAAGGATSSRNGRTTGQDAPFVHPKNPTGRTPSVDMDQGSLGRRPRARGDAPAHVGPRTQVPIA